MKKAPVTTTKPIEKDIAPILGMLIGKIVRIDESGQVFVDFPGNKSGPVVTMVDDLVQERLMGKGQQAGRQVMLVFENNDPHRPAIVGTKYSLVGDIMEQTSNAIALEVEKPEEIIINGKRVVFNADDEFVIQCGKSSIILTKAGKILIEGEYVLSSSTGVNKIQGGSIEIS